MWPTGWEGSLGENGYMCIYIIGWVPLLPLETVTTLLIGYTSNKKLKTKKHCRRCCWVAKSICLSFCLPWKTLYSFAFTNRTHCWFASLTSHCFSVSLPPLSVFLSMCIHTQTNRLEIQAEFLLRETSVLPLRPSTGWMRPTHIIKGRVISFT